MSDRSNSILESFASSSIDAHPHVQLVVQEGVMGTTMPRIMRRMTRQGNGRQVNRTEVKLSKNQQHSSSGDYYLLTCFRANDKSFLLRPTDRLDVQTLRDRSNSSAADSIELVMALFSSPQTR